MRVFALLVPLLLGFATVLFACSRRSSAWLRGARRAASTARHDWGRSVAALLPVSIYGGYFGGGVGVLLLAVLSIGTGGDYRSANVTKNLVTSLNCGHGVGGLRAGAAMSLWTATLGDDGGCAGRRLLGAIAQVRRTRSRRARVVVVGVVGGDRPALLVLSMPGDAYGLCRGHEGRRQATTRSIWVEADGWSVGTIDQTLLPHRSRRSG